MDCASSSLMEAWILEVCMGPVGPRTRFRHAFPLRRRPVIATGPAIAETTVILMPVGLLSSPACVMCHISLVMCRHLIGAVSVVCVVLVMAAPYEKGYLLNLLNTRDAHRMCTTQPHATRCCPAAERYDTARTVNIRSCNWSGRQPSCCASHVVGRQRKPLSSRVAPRSLPAVGAPSFASAGAAATARLWRRAHARGH